MARTIKEIRPTVDSSDDVGISLNMGNGENLVFTWEQIQESCQGGMSPTAMLIENIGIDLCISGIDPFNRAAVIQHFNGTAKYKVFQGNLMAMTTSKTSEPAVG